MKIDAHSETWLAVKSTLEKRIESLRDELEADQEEHRTALIRGQIAQCREILALGESAPSMSFKNTYNNGN